MPVTYNSLTQILMDPAGLVAAYNQLQQDSAQFISEVLIESTDSNSSKDESKGPLDSGKGNACGSLKAVCVRPNGKAKFVIQL